VREVEDVRGVMMTKKRGFAAMPMHRQLEIAAAGGRAAQASGKAHHWTREEARIAAVKAVARRTQAARKGGA
jgi:uncharacterized protein